MSLALVGFAGFLVNDYVRAANNTRAGWSAALAVCFAGLAMICKFNGL